MVRHICQNDAFAVLLNATDYEGNTPLHLAVKHGFPRIVSLLLQTMTVETGVTNKYGLTAGDLGRRALAPGRWYYFLVSLCYLAMHASIYFFVMEMALVLFGFIINANS